MLRKDGSVFFADISAAPFNLDRRTCLVGLVRDITDRKRQEERILKQAHYDSLTNLPHRFLVLDRLSQLLSEASRSDELVAVLFLDLDDFKKINDTLGHEPGRFPATCLGRTDAWRAGSRRIPALLSTAGGDQANPSN